MLDTSGDALGAGCEAGPTIVKPNMEEARELTTSVCREGASDREVAEALLSMGPENLVISMGKEGAMLATATGLEMARTPTVTERNPIGAGDSMVGGIIWGQSQDLSLSESVKCGIACGAATASQSGTALGTHEMVLDLMAQI